MHTVAEIALRQWQADALTAWVSKGHRGVAEVVTGAGKTVLALAAMTIFWRRWPDLGVRIVVPSLALLDQWIVEIVERGVVAERDLQILSGKVRSVRGNSRVCIGVVNSLRTKRFADPVFLIADEVHRYASRENSRALEGDLRATLGLSATPESEYDNRFEEVIEARLGGIFFKYGVAEGVRDGILSPFVLRHVRIPLTKDERLRYSRLTQSIARTIAREGATSERAIGLLRRRARMVALAEYRIPATIKLTLAHPGTRVLIFHESTAHADRIARALTASHRPVALYHSKIGSAERRDNLRMFRKGITDVLVACRALDEGFNAPSTDLAIIASATSTTRQRIQRLGRVLRRAAGKDLAVVYTLYATAAEEARLREEQASLGASVTNVIWQELRPLHG